MRFNQHIMTTISAVIRALVLMLLVLTSVVASTSGQGASIPDPGLNAAIRAALNRPLGPLTEQDLLSLTNLDASRRNVGSIDGLEAARNLASLDLQINSITNFSLPLVWPYKVPGNAGQSWSVALQFMAGLTVHQQRLRDRADPAVIAQEIDVRFRQGLAFRDQ